jgi:nucleoside-diphosphate-sugar epimerase
MKPINIYINGTSGFIGGTLVKYIENNQNYITFNNYKIPVKVIQVPRKLEEEYIYKGIFIQMASPSDIFDFKNQNEMKISMIDDVNNNINIAIKNKLIFIFCSSLAVEDTKLNTYGEYKLKIENRLNFENLVDTLNSFILRIPRVYGRYRKKGLMYQLRNSMVPLEDFHKEISFMEIDSFIEEFIEYLVKIIMESKTIPNRVITFPNTKTLTIGQIKDYYNL